MSSHRRQPEFPGNHRKQDTVREYWKRGRPDILETWYYWERREQRWREMSRWAMTTGKSFFIVLEVENAETSGRILGRKFQILLGFIRPFPSAAPNAGRREKSQIWFLGCFNGFFSSWVNLNREVPFLLARRRSRRNYLSPLLRVILHVWWAWLANRSWIGSSQNGG